MSENYSHDIFTVTGMTCSACSAHVEKSVGSLSGVKEVQVNLLAGSMAVTYDETVTAVDIISAVKSGGYGAFLKGEKPTSEKTDDQVENMKKRLIYSLIFLIPLMYISMGHMIGAPLTHIFSENKYLSAFALTQFILTVPVLFINRKFFIVGGKALINKSPNMDTLVGVGSASSMAYGIYAMYAIMAASGSGNFDKAHSLSMNLYFESAAMILTLITAGKYMEARAKKHTSDAVKALSKLAPDTARIIRDGKETAIPAEEIVPGDRVIVRTGESFPCDGKVVKGSGAADESALTGESIPVLKEEGASVTGATILRSGYIEFTADAVGKDTLFAKIIKRVEEASGAKAPVARLADKVCAVFVPAVMTLSLITFILWMLISRDTGEALNFAVCVLVISCPCALGLATPTAIMAGTGRGAQLGILFKNAEVLETLHRAKVVVTDKTGTITQGRPTVTDIIPAPGYAEETLLTLAAAVETKSEHPLALAVVEKASGLSLPVAGNFVQHPGGGVCADVEGKKVLAGNKDFLKTQGIMTPSFDNLQQEGKTLLFFAYGGEFIGAMAVRDDLKEGTKEAVLRLKKRGLEIVMLTGDNQTTALAVAKEAGIEKVIAQVHPEDKEESVRKIMESGKVTAMIGDGVNDAPALTRADVGIAVGGGTEAAMASADVVLMSGNFAHSVDAIDLSHAVMRNIKQNLFWAFFYNVLGIPLAAGVLYPAFGIRLTPMFASFSMSLSSLFVVTNALRLRYFGKTKINNRKEEKIMTKTILIKGMMCTHCTGRVEGALNALEGASAVVNLDEGGKAVVTLTKDISDDILAKTVTDAGYEVVSIK